MFAILPLQVFSCKHPLSYCNQSFSLFWECTECTMCSGTSYTPLYICGSIFDIVHFVHPLLNSVPINTYNLKVSKKSQISYQLSENEFLFFLRHRRTTDLANWSVFHQCLHTGVQKPTVKWMVSSKSTHY